MFSSFAVAFSYISPSTGIFTLFALGLTTIGGVFIWTWPVVALGQFIIALNFAEVSSHYPVAGSVFQWTKYLASRTYSWFTGWIYLFAGILTVTAVVATLPLALIPALNGLGWHSLNSAPRLHTQLVVALITLVVITVLNIYGVRLVAIINNTGVLFEILGMFVFAMILMAFHNHQGFHVVTNSAGFHVGPSTFLAAMFMSLFVIYGFDTASTLAEETRDPRRAAPKAVLFSVIGAFIIGGVFLLGTLMAIPNLHTAINGNAAGGPGATSSRPTSPPRSRPSTCSWSRRRSSSAACRSWPRRSGCASGCPATTSCRSPGRWPGSRRACTRRSGPASRSRCWPRSRSSSTRAPAIIAIAATGMIYLSYFLGNLVILRARLAAGRKASAPFKLGRWGLLVNIVGLLYGGAMLVNFAWPRAASNPKPNQTGGACSARLPHRLPERASRSCGRCSSSSC